jgi:hypothetical protein
VLIFDGPALAVKNMGLPKISSFSVTYAKAAENYLGYQKWVCFM